MTLLVNDHEVLQAYLPDKIPSKEQILYGKGSSLTLETMLQQRRVNSTNFLGILVDIAWWLMKLHDESKSWKVLFHLNNKRVGVKSCQGLVFLTEINSVKFSVTITVDFFPDINIFSGRCDFALIFTSFE